MGHLKEALIRKTAGAREQRELEARRRAMTEKYLAQKRAATMPKPKPAQMLVNGKPAPRIGAGREVQGGTVDRRAGVPQPVGTAETSPVRTGILNMSEPRGQIIDRDFSARQQRVR